MWKCRRSGSRGTTELLVNAPFKAAGWSPSTVTYLTSSLDMLVLKYIQNTPKNVKDQLSHDTRFWVPREAVDDRRIWIVINIQHWKRLWCWEGLGAGGEGDDRGWDGWMASLTRWTWVSVNSRSWWWTGRPGVLRFMGSQRVGHDWVTDLTWLSTNGYGRNNVGDVHPFGGLFGGWQNWMWVVEEAKSAVNPVKAEQYICMVWNSCLPPLGRQAQSA